MIAWCAAITFAAVVVRPTLDFPDRDRTGVLFAGLSAAIGCALVVAWRAGAPRRALLWAGSAFSLGAVPLYWMPIYSWSTASTFTFIGLLLGVLALGGTAAVWSRAAIVAIAVDAINSELARAADIGAIVARPYVDVVALAVVTTAAFVAARRISRDR